MFLKCTCCVGSVCGEFLFMRCARRESLYRIDNRRQCQPTFFLSSDGNPTILDGLPIPGGRHDDGSLAAGVACMTDPPKQRRGSTTVIEEEFFVVLTSHLHSYLLQIHMGDCTPRIRSGIYAKWMD
ncbi:hypothetical protein GCK32_019163 [Trichostrongylus colubriformis]|uniref:Uncharacterized protein n=1 Tax=Trichostrongylus colubriformis TaxID=6319 RepID=A0AAN8ETJ1_TRICO